MILAGNQEGVVDYGGLALKTASTFLFTVKFNPAGLPLWGKAFGGSADQEAVTVATDARATSCSRAPPRRSPSRA